MAIPASISFLTIRSPVSGPKYALQISAQILGRAIMGRSSYLENRLSLPFVKKEMSAQIYKVEPDIEYDLKMKLFPDDQDDKVLIFGSFLIVLSLSCFGYNYMALTTGDVEFPIFVGRARCILEFFPMGLILSACILFVLALFYLVYEITISGIALFVLNVVNIILAIKTYPIILTLKQWG